MSFDFLPRLQHSDAAQRRLMLDPKAIPLVLVWRYVSPVGGVLVKNLLNDCTLLQNLIERCSRLVGMETDGAWWAWDIDRPGIRFKLPQPLQRPLDVFVH